MRSLACATTAGAWAALVDVTDGFDPVSADACGVRRDRLLWVRCAGRLGAALQAADVIVRGGGFEVIAVDLGDLAPPARARIPVSALVRLQRGVERTPTALVFVGPQRVTGSTSALTLALTPAGVRWAPGGPGLLTALTVDARLVRARDRVPGTRVRLAWRIPGTTGWPAGGHEG
jgi:hypothetical protein